MVSGRIPLYVKEYCEQKKIPISDLMMQGFDSFRATDITHAEERYTYHENRLLHWKRIVLQQEEQCNTKQNICNTIKDTFLSNGRGSPETKRVDMNWCDAKAEQLVNEGMIITGRELYEFCKRK